MTAPRKHTLELYVDNAGQHRWRRRAGNGEIISTSSEGYVDRRDALHGMRIANADWQTVRIVDAEYRALTDLDVDGEEP